MAKLKGKVTTLVNKDGTEARFPRTKVKAVTDDTGRGLNDILSEIDNEINRINSGAQVNLIWENASPTSAFLKGDIEITEEYDVIILIYSLASSSNQRQSICIPHKDISSLYVPTATINKDIVYRRYNIKNNSLSVDEGHILPESGGETVNNTVLIPYRIYGVR